MDLSMVNSYSEWVEIYKKLVYWELELEHINDTGMIEILKSQKQEANSLFFKFVKEHYREWINEEQAPVLSNTLFKKVILPEITETTGTLLVVIDNLRYDQFNTIEKTINNHYR